MNKFQRIAYQVSKDDSKKEVYKGLNIKKEVEVGIQNGIVTKNHGLLKNV